MPSLRQNFDELVFRIGQGRELGPTGVEPIYYLVFPPNEMVEVKRLLPAWQARLRNEGWEVLLFSMAEQIADILAKAPLRKIWLAADAKAPLDWSRTNQSLANAVVNGSLHSRLEQLLVSLNGRKDALVLVTDLEALHPYLRIGAIEAQLYGKFSVPTIFLYPGTRSGKTRLSFLGFYPEDGNYRSNHVGG